MSASCHRPSTPLRLVAMVAGILLLAACGGPSGEADGSSGDQATGEVGDGSGSEATDDTAGTGDGALGTARQPATPAPEAPPRPVTTTTYDLGSVELADGAPAPLRGIVAVPDDLDAPAPVVLVLHGSHTICRDDPSGTGTWPCPAGTENPHEEGLTWLVEALAARGLVAVAPGVNVQYTLGAGEPGPATRTSEVVSRTLDALAAGDLDVAPADVDVDRLALVGHSVGGQDVSLLARGRAGFTRPVATVVLLQPALIAADALPLADVPATVVVNECDGDTGLSGAVYVSDRLTTTNAAPAALVAIAGGSHNATNSGLPPDGFPVESPGCEAIQELDEDGRAALRQDQRDLLTELVPGAVLAGLGAETGGWAGRIFEEPAAPEGVTVSVVPAAARVAPIPGADPSVVEALDTDGLAVTYCPEGYYTPMTDPGTEPCHRPELSLMVGQAATLAVVWDTAGASVRLPVTGTTGDVLRLRAYADPADARLPEGDIVLRLRADDGSTAEVVVPVPPTLRFDTGIFEIAGSFLPWTTASWALGADLQAVTLEVVSPTEGALQLVSLGVD